MVFFCSSKNSIKEVIAIKLESSHLEDVRSERYRLLSFEKYLPELPSSVSKEILSASGFYLRSCKIKIVLLLKYVYKIISQLIHLFIINLFIKLIESGLFLTNCFNKFNLI